MFSGNLILMLGNLFDEFELLNNLHARKELHGVRYDETYGKGQLNYVKYRSFLLQTRQNYVSDFLPYAEHTHHREKDINSAN